MTEQHEEGPETDIKEKDIEQAVEEENNATDKFQADRCSGRETQGLYSDNAAQGRLIRHYLLLPTYEWGIADWHLDIIRPFVKKHAATVGFSLEEAALAEMVTAIGNDQTFPEELLDRLRSAGCKVERIDGDGTTIASKLAER